jgi:hypothetical protein
MRRLRSLVGNLGRSVVRPIVRVGSDLLDLVPALLAGAGVFLIVAGLFNYLQPVAAAPGDTPAASLTMSAAPYSLPPLRSIAPSGSGSVQAAIATRVRIQALGIDLPIVASPPHEEFPLCDVAEFLTFDKPAAYPGLPQATYLYAHARTGMFLPLLTTSQTNDGAAMLGMWVEVFTDDDQRHVYEIKRVLRHVSGSSALDAAAAAKTDQLWLQTSEGPLASSTKLQVYAEPVGVVAASSADAHPAGKGSVCPKAPKCLATDGTGCTPA